MEIKKREYPFDLLNDITNVYNKDDLDWILEHFDENINYLFERNKNIFNEREINILFAIYKDGLSLKAAAEKFELTSERIKQILTKTQRKLKHPSLIKYLVNGKEIEEKVNNLRNNKLYYLDSFEKITNEMSKEEINELVEKDINTEINGIDIEFLEIEKLDLSTRIINALKRADINYVRDLMKLTKEGILEIENISTKSLEEIISVINNHKDIDKEINSYVKSWINELGE